MELSRLTKVQLREAWPHEASDFTSWLAEEENLQLLSDEIGIDISLLETEASVGRYYVDILAEEETSGRRIVIENQLEATNHDHLGKLMFRGQILILRIPTRDSRSGRYSRIAANFLPPMNSAGSAATT